MVAQQMASKPVLMPEPLGMFGAGLLSRGKQFLGAFELLSNGARIDFPHAAYFNLAHALELFLKAFLAAKEAASKQEMHEIGHRLVRLLNRCVACGLPPIEKLGDLAKHLQEVNSDHDLRYPTDYRLILPHANACSTIMHALEEAIAPIVQSAYVDAVLHFAADTRHLRGKKVSWSD